MAVYAEEKARDVRVFKNHSEERNGGSYIHASFRDGALTRLVFIHRENGNEIGRYLLPIYNEKVLGDLVGLLTAAQIRIPRWKRENRPAFSVAIEGTEGLKKQ